MIVMIMTLFKRHPGQDVISPLMALHIRTNDDNISKNMILMVFIVLIVLLIVTVLVVISIIVILTISS